MEFKSNAELVAIIITPFGIVAWAVIQFFTKRIVSSLDRNSNQLEMHSGMITAFSQKLEKLSDQFLHNNQITKNEITSVLGKMTGIDSEVDLLRKVRHEHANEITIIALKADLLDKRLNKLDSQFDDFNNENKFMHERLHDIVTAISNLHGIAKMQYEWPLPDEVPNIRGRKDKK